MALAVILVIPAAMARPQGLTAGRRSGAPDVRVRMMSAGTITLNGSPDEPAWAKAPVIHLTQQAPHPGAPTPFRTEVCLLAEGKHSYLRTTCIDSDPSRLWMRSLARDIDQTA